ncbi:membrane protein, partial [Lentzea aerocolonigenes]
MFGLVGLTFGVALGSALIPFISVEAWVVGVGARWPGVSCWLVGLVVAVAQVLGKLLYFYAARGDIKLPNWLRRKEKTKPSKLCLLYT